MLKILHRIAQRIRYTLHQGQELNRRVEIENYLIRIANGDAPLPTRDDCRILAFKLGVPKEHWRDDWDLRPKIQMGYVNKEASPCGYFICPYKEEEVEKLLIQNGYSVAKINPSKSRGPETRKIFFHHNRGKSEF